jgi:hypothetical protein
VTEKGYAVYGGVFKKRKGNGKGQPAKQVEAKMRSHMQGQAELIFQNVIGVGESRFMARLFELTWGTQSL